MPKIKSEQYLRDIMTKFRNKVVYDSATGEVKDDRKFMSMMEDFWIPRRGEGKSTEITTLPAGQNLGELADVQYFEKKLYRSLNVPVSRLEQNQGFSLGRSTEITRDEIKFSKFINKLRTKFSLLFDELMERQLALKGICSVDEWQKLKEKIHYDFLKDNNFMEQFDEEGIERMAKEMAEEEAAQPQEPMSLSTPPPSNLAEPAANNVAAQPTVSPSANDLNQSFNAQITK
jgi:hypothetical protein